MALVVEYWVPCLIVWPTCWEWYSGTVSHCLLIMMRRMQAATLNTTVNMVTMVGNTMSCSTGRDTIPPLLLPPRNGFLDKIFSIPSRNSFLFNGFWFDGFSVSFQLCAEICLWESTCGLLGNTSWQSLIILMPNAHQSLLWLHTVTKDIARL